MFSATPARIKQQRCVVSDQFIKPTEAATARRMTGSGGHPVLPVE